ncbi:MAG: MFS transporter [Gammaproteobacteria bacterium]|nr:MFS transporter [Gammaproteobacteria bacterium]MBL6999710.1 MFS transporter [Gammaproteobacteria bacterium]
MLFLGFSAGLPILLVFGTLSAWLRVEGVDKTTIGFVSWVALAYGFKFIWSPLVDRLALPWLGKWLGQRRSWMLLAQIGVIYGLISMALSDPVSGLQAVIVFAIVTAFSSATQDISIDAWRIEAIGDDFQGAMAGAYQLGYRLGMILAGGGAFSLAHFYGWPTAYLWMAFFMLSGVITVLLIEEPDHSERLKNIQLEQQMFEQLNLLQGCPSALVRFQQWVVAAVISPFAEFFARNGLFAVVILGFIMVFRISDITLGVMANPFYIDMGYSELDIGLVTKTVGPFVTIGGALLGGVLVMHYGRMRMLMTGAILVVITNLLFAWLATQDAELIWLILVVGADNLAAGIATTTFIAYLSALTNKAYTATQYALFSSIMLLLAKFVAGFSGLIVDASSYPIFFAYAAALGVPSIGFILVLMRHENLRKAENSAQ